MSASGGTEHPFVEDDPAPPAGAGWRRVGPLWWRREGDDFAFCWPRVGLVVTAERLREERGEVYAECVATLSGDDGSGGGSGGGGGHLHTWRLNLWSSRAHGEVAKHLAAAYPPVTGRLSAHGLDWTAVLEAVRTITLREWRRPPEPVRLRAVADAAPQRWLLSDFLVRGETNLLVGDRGAGKSTIAAIAAVTAASGKAVVPRLAPAGDGGPMGVLILDWETTAPEWAERLRSLSQAGLGLPDIPDGVRYLRMTRPYVEQAREVMRLVSREGVGLVIVDSALFAVAGDPKEVPGPRDLLNALAALGPEVTRLVLIHVTKEDARDGKRPARAYGTALWEAGARCIWEARGSAEANEYLGLGLGPDGPDGPAAGTAAPTPVPVSVLDIGLVNSKVSRGRLRRPFGLRVFYDDRELPVDVSYLSADDLPVLHDRLSLTARVLAALRGGPRLLHEVAEEVGETVPKVEATLRRLRQAGRVLRSDDLPAHRRPKGPAVTWLLLAGA